MLEAKQSKRELGKKPVISPRKECTPTDVDGAASGYMTTYKEMVEIDVTFKEPGGNSATTRLVFVVIKGLSSKIMIGCPTLDAHLYHCPSVGAPRFCHQLSSAYV